MNPNNLSPQLNSDQLKQNIDALQKGGMKTDDIQSYVNNYKADGKGGYVLSSAQAAPAQPSAPNLADRLGSDTEEHAGNIAEDISTGLQNAKTEKNPIEAVGEAAESGLDIAGNVAGEVGDFFGEPLKSAYDTVVPQTAKDGLTGAVKSVAGAPAAQGVISAYKTFQAQHPDAAKNIGNFVNIATLFGGEGAAKAADPVVDAAKDTVSSAAESITKSAADRTAANESSKVWEAIKPTLTPTETAAGVKDGSVTTKGILKTVTQVPKGDDLKMIEAAKPYVLDAKSPDLAVHNMQQGIRDSATKVRQGLEQSDAIWNKNELKGALGKISEPLTVKSDQTLHNTFNNFKSAVLKIADKADKKTVGILDTRQQLDKLIESELGPTIYDKSNPMAKVVRDFRSTLNDFAESKIPDGKLPDGSSFKGELKKQSLLYKAIDNTAPKIGKEGSNIISRWIKANPVKAKALGYGAAGIGLGAAGAHLIGL